MRTMLFFLAVLANPVWGQSLTCPIGSRPVVDGNSVRCVPNAPELTPPALDRFLEPRAPSTQIMSGDRVGNGGDAVVCPNGTVRFLDRMEAESVGLDHVLEGQNLNFREAYEALMTRLSSRMPIQFIAARRAIGDSMVADLDQFLDDVEANPELIRTQDTNYPTTRFTRQELTDIPDSFEQTVPAGCVVAQLAIQTSPRSLMDKRFTIQKDLFLRLSPLDQASLVLHEVLYEFFIELRKKDSISTRKLNFVLASEVWTRMSNVELLFELRRLGVREFAGFQAFDKLGLGSKEWVSFNSKCDEKHFTNQINGNREFYLTNCRSWSLPLDVYEDWINQGFKIFHSDLIFVVGPRRIKRTEPNFFANLVQTPEGVRVAGTQISFRENFPKITHFPGARYENGLLHLPISPSEFQKLNGSKDITNEFFSLKNSPESLNDCSLEFSLAPRMGYSRYLLKDKFRLRNGEGKVIAGSREEIGPAIAQGYCD